MLTVLSFDELENLFGFLRNLHIWWFDMPTHSKLPFSSFPSILCSIFI